MKQALKKIISGEHLTRSEAKSDLIALCEDSISSHQQAAYLVAMQSKGVQLEELEGFQDALLELCTPIHFGTHEFIDVCGTGGDGKDTFNVSTCSAFVLASMGYPVVKHGNYGVSSQCGSSNVLEALGIKFSDNPIELRDQFERTGIVFLHAPLFHPALKKMANVRTSLGIPTFFNDLGPLVNPARPNYQLTGTYRLSLARMYSHILTNQRTGFYVLHGLKGYDELTFDGPTRVISKEEDFVLQTSPNQQTISVNELKGGNIHESKQTIETVLSGKGNSSQNTVVAGNVALGIRCFDPKTTFESAFAKALNHLDSGISIQLLNKIRS